MEEAARLTTLAEVDHLFDARQSAPVVVFKHSLVCPLSSMAWSAYEAFLATRDPGEGASSQAGSEARARGTPSGDASTRIRR